MKVYLSGGMKSNWQEKVIMACPGIQFINPMDHGMEEENSYSVWDLEGVKYCDVIFAYMEKDNPYGHGVCSEIGYAYGLGKTVVMVDEKRDGHMGIARWMAHIWMDTLDEGIEYLQKLGLVYGVDNDMPFHGVIHFDGFEVGKLEDDLGWTLTGQNPASDGVVR